MANVAARSSSEQDGRWMRAGERAEWEKIEAMGHGSKVLDGATEGEDWREGRWRQTSTAINKRPHEPRSREMKIFEGKPKGALGDVLV
jgi:hypothetical protein